MTLELPSYQSWKFERLVPAPTLPDGRTIVPGLTGKLYVRGKGDTEDSMVRYFFKLFPNNLMQRIMNPYAEHIS